MSRRLHATEIGSIACYDLSDLGAGREGWLVDNPNLLTALDTHSLALFDRSIFLILHWSDGADLLLSDAKLFLISLIKAEYISAIQWLVFDDITVLAVGTSSGFLLIYSLQGDLIHKQLLNTKKIIKLKVRGTKKELEEDA